MSIKAALNENGICVCRKMAIDVNIWGNRGVLKAIFTLYLFGAPMPQVLT